MGVRKWGPCLMWLALSCDGGAVESDCGDGVQSELEACDDGNAAEGDGCTPLCTVERGWFCPSGGACETACGDGVVAGNEVCDDGNRIPNDGCSETCTLETVVGRLSAVTGADPGQVVISNAVTVNVSPGTLLQISALGRFDEVVVVDGVAKGASARVAGRSEVALRMTASPDFVTSRTTALVVDDARLNWVVTTRTSTYAWRTGEWGPCSNPCGDGFQSRDVSCLDETGAKVDEALCDLNAPDNVRSCTETRGCTHAYSPWTPWSECMNDVRTRTRDCIREDGELVACTFCGNLCRGMIACDVNCASLSGTVAYCAPRIPGDKDECDEILSTSRDRCLNAGCATTAASSPECTLGGNPNVPQCYGGLIECE